MNNLLKIALLAAAISSCSTEQVPTPGKLSLDVQALPPSTVISVIAEESYKTPKGSQVVEKSGVFKVKDNIYSERGSQVLIPRGAIVGGSYANDGVSCTVTWNSVYANADEYAENRGSFELSNVSSPTICNPTRGVKKNDRLVIHLDRGNAY